MSNEPKGQAMDSVVSAFSLYARNNLRDLIPYYDNDPARKDLAEAYLADWDAWCNAADAQRTMMNWAQFSLILVIPAILVCLYILFVGNKKLDACFAKVKASQKAYYAYVEANGGTAIEQELLRRHAEGQLQ